MKHYNALTGFGTVKNSTYAFFAFQPDLKEVIAHCTGMWHSKIWPKLQQWSVRHLRFRNGCSLSDRYKPALGCNA
jgi:hypothetical protein